MNPKLMQVVRSGPKLDRLKLQAPKKRNEMGQFGYSRVVNELSWEFESKKLIKFYQQLFINRANKFY